MSSDLENLTLQCPCDSYVALFNWQLKCGSRAQRNSSRIFHLLLVSMGS